MGPGGKRAGCLWSRDIGSPERPQSIWALLEGKGKEAGRAENRLEAGRERPGGAGDSISIEEGTQPLSY